MKVVWFMVGVIFFVIILAKLTGGCNAEVEARNILRKQGYTHVEIGDYRFFACGSSDSFNSTFKAVSPNGENVDGVVCCGLLKNCTVRFNH